MDILRLAELFESVFKQVLEKTGSYDEPDSSSEQHGFTIVLDNKNGGEDQYQDAPLFSGQTLAVRTPEKEATAQQPIAAGMEGKKLQKTAQDKNTKKSARKPKNPIPEQIRRMRNLYQPGDCSFSQLLKNFYVQGKFMENYEDNKPWRDGEIYGYWLTYHTLSLAQLRGYFTWRTEIRKGNYQENCAVFILIYLSELINEIGTASAEESLHKMQEFEKNYVDAGFSLGYRQYNIRQWMFDFAVVNGFAPEIASQYADPKILEIDAGIEILHYPEKYSDQEVFESLCMFSGKSPDALIVIQKHKEEGIRLFAAIWKLALAQYRQGEKNLFTSCFGRKRSQYWHPLNNTFYYERRKKETVIYELNQCRKYSFKDNIWREHSYHPWYGGHQKIAELFHEADRRLRRYLNTGRPLKERKEEAWAVPYIEAVIAEDRKAKIEAARPKITINFAGLEKIRQDSLETQGSLLTEEDTQGAPAPEAASAVQTQASAKAGTASSVAALPSGTALPLNDAPILPSGAVNLSEASAPLDDTQALPSAAVNSSKTSAPLDDTQNLPSKAVNSSGVSVPLDDTQDLPSETSAPLDNAQVRLLRMLLRGEPVQALIAAQHGLPHVIADSINEALFDYIGDNAVDCDGETLTLVEDYRDDIAEIVG